MYKTREQKNAYSRKWYAKNKGKVKEWHERNKVRRRITSDNWRKEHRDKINGAAREWHKKNPDKAKATQVKYKFKVSLEQIELLLTRQDNCCAICRKALLPGKGTHIDHDHKSNRVRGMLCQKCNQAIGLFNDNIGILESAIHYLKQAT